MSQPAHQKWSAGPAEPVDLAAILSPVSPDSFLAGDYGRRFVRVAGTPGKFSKLLPWPVLNEILEQHRLEPPRLRLTRDGKPVPAERYLSFQSNRRKTGQPIPRLNSTALTRELREGATLVLDNVDELHSPIRRLAQSLERIFHVRVQVNSYSGWRTSHGFDLHWDDHDVFILQVAGRKNWKVYGMTRPFPLSRDTKAAVEPPSEVLWEGVLEDGDLLYIPRGWWHVATPLDEPTLHLTVGVNNPTGADFLSWFVERLRDIETVRRDIPHLQGSSSMAAYCEQLREAMTAAWRPELVEEFMSHLDAQASPRARFTLPWSATEAIIPPGSWSAQWNGARPARLEIAEEEIAVISQGRRWRFAPAARPLLELLVSGRPCDQADMEDAAAGSLPSNRIQEFVRELAANGLVVLR